MAISFNNIKVVSIKSIGMKKNVDISVPGNNNFFLTNGILTHNSGKSQLNKVSIDICRRIGLKATELTEFTTSGLIGTFDKAKHDHNVKNNLKPGDDFIITDKQGNQKSKKYQIPITYGDMYYYDILFIDEAKILFEKSRHTENVLSILQPALDYPGRVRKKLSAEEPIEYDCSCTLVSSTVEWGKVGIDIMSQGFFPRCLFYSKSLSVNDYINMHKALTESFFNEEQYNELIKNFSEMIEKHEHPISRIRRKVMVSLECLEDINNNVLKWFNTISEKLYGAESHVAKPFVSSLHGFIYKLAAQVAVLNNHINTNITNEKVFLVGHEEVEYATELINDIFNHLITSLSLEESAEDKSLYHLAILVMKTMFDKKVQYIHKEDAIKIIMSTKNMGRNRSTRLLTTMINSNLMKEKLKNGKTNIIEPNWKIWYEKITKKNPMKEIDEGEINDTDM
jgi:hypothetical protein